MNKRGNRASRLAGYAAALMLSAVFLALAACGAADGAEGTFTFSDSGVTASGGAGGYEIDGTALTIRSAGRYTLTGSCSDGSVRVKKGTRGVALILDGLTLTATDTAPISCNQDSEVEIRVQGVNTLTDGEDPADEDAGGQAAQGFEGAAIKVSSGASLKLTGPGTLNIDASACRNGVKGGAEASVTVDGPTLNIDAANTALACDGSLAIRSGSLDLAAGGTGVKADPDEEDGASAGEITITGGDFSIAAADDGIHAAGELTITDGSFTISAGDDAIHSDAALTIGAQGADSGPEITVTGCAEGFEGAVVNLHSGSGSITSSDDGVNAANSDLGDYSFCINITGGDWYVDAGGDGLDSNGSITISGGVTEVYGAENGSGMDTSVDSEQGCSITGGTLFTVDTNGVTPAGVAVRFGSAVSGMGGGPGGAQGGMPESTDGAHGVPAQGMSCVLVAKGSSIEVKDSGGGTLYAATAPKSGNTVVLSGDRLTAGQEYTLYVDGSAVGAATAGESAGAGGPPGAPGGQQPGDRPDKKPDAPADGGSGPPPGGGEPNAANQPQQPPDASPALGA